MNTVFGSFDDYYSYEDLFKKLEVINDLNSKTIAFTDLYDHIFEFFELPQESDIIRLKKAFMYAIPEEYIEFLRLTNGLELSADSRLLNIDEIVEIREIFYYPNNIMVVAQVQAETHICIDLSSKDDLYMYVTEPIGPGKAYSLNCDFKQFLIRFIKSYGAPFWVWGADWNKTISTEEV